MQTQTPTIIKITRVIAENYKRLKLVDVLFPERGPFHVTGRNGQGKTSFLDAIWECVGGRRVASAAEVPIRTGEERAFITIETDAGYTITRRFWLNAKTGELESDLVVENKEGARFPSPQHLLNAFLNSIAFDPLDFMRLDEAEQYDQLRRLIPLDVDIDALNGLNARDYEARRDANREAERLRAQASGIHFPEGLPESEIDVAGLTAELGRSSEGNAAVERERARRDRLRDQAATVRTEARTTTASIPGEIQKIDDALNRVLTRLAGEEEALLQRLAAIRDQRDQETTGAGQARQETRERLEAEAAGLHARAEAIDRELAEAEPLAETIDTAAHVARIAEAQAINTQIAERNRHRSLIAEAEDYARRAAALTEAMAERERQKRAAIEAAKMPIDGLTFGDGRVLFRDLPLRQASQAEQLRVSTSIAMALNPGLRLIVIRDGAVLDDDSLAEVAAMAEAADYQCAIESIDPTGKVGIIMEAGEVAEIVTPEVAAQQLEQRPARRRRQPAPEGQGGLL